MPTINMLSSADLVKGQGVSSAYHEQVSLVSEGLKGKYDVLINSKKRCDINHFHTINPEFFIYLSMDKKKYSNVGYVHFLPETVEESLDIPKAGKKMFYKYMIEFYKNMDYLVTVNPYFIGELEKYGINRDKVTYIPNYVSDSLFHVCSLEEVQNAKKAWEIPEDKFIVLGVGQVQTRKGVLDFIETAKKMPEVYFIWAGGFSFGAMTDGYKELKESIACAPENVKFLGIIDRSKMNELYNICDVMFLPSYNELFPMTILESMCVGKPILLRDLDIYKDILFNYYLKGENVDEFVKMIEMLKNDEGQRKIWIEKSFEGNKFYSKENVLNLWESFYDRVYTESKEKQNLNKKYLFSSKKYKLSSNPKKVKNIEFKNFFGFFNAVEFDFFKKIFGIEKKKVMYFFKEEQKVLKDIFNIDRYIKK